MKTFKSLTWILALSCLLNGCTTVYTPQGEKQIVATAEHTLVNNTGFNLDVNVNGATVYHRITPGQVVGVRPTFLTSRTVVIVTAYDADGLYHGASSSVFYLNQPRAWIISGTD